MIDLPRTKRPVRETTIKRAALVAVSRLPGVVCLVNNTGKSPVACKICRPHLCKRCRPRLIFPIQFGLGEGGPDLVGIITLAGPSFPIAAPFGLEIKTPHARKAHKERLLVQESWRRVARLRGMLSDVVTSADEAVAAVETFRVEYTRRIVVIS